MAAHQVRARGWASSRAGLGTDPHSIRTIPIPAPNRFEPGARQRAPVARSFGNENRRRLPAGTRRRGGLDPLSAGLEDIPRSGLSSAARANLSAGRFEVSPARFDSAKEQS